MCLSDEDDGPSQPRRKRLKKQAARAAAKASPGQARSTSSLQSRSSTVDTVLSEAGDQTRFSDTPDWFGFFGKGKEKPGMKTGKFSRELLKQQFGDVLCLPCVVAKSNPPWCFKWCPCPNTPNHTADGAAHNPLTIGKARSEWAKIKESGREKDFWWQA